MVRAWSWLGVEVMGTVEILSPAKVNLSLEVLARREDGFHELTTHMLCVGLHDTVRISWQSKTAVPLELKVTGPAATADIPVDDRNLLYRAVRDALLHAQELGYVPEAGVLVELEKHIPSQAGLGGGSSNAAAGVAAVRSLTGVDLAPERVFKDLASLGSDCVFFEAAKQTGAALCSGRGERVKPWASPQGWWVALAVPTATCPTGDVYSQLKFPLSPFDPGHRFSDLVGMHAVEARAFLVNHLQEAAVRAQPDLKAWIKALAAAGLDHFMLSGSGSTFFGLYASEREAQEELDGLLSHLEGSGLGCRLSRVVPVAGHGSYPVPARP